MVDAAVLPEVFLKVLKAKELLANGAARVLAVPVAEESGYAAAFALVQEQEGVNVVVCDSEKLAVQQKLRDSVMSASAERRERIAVVAGAAGETAEALVKRAGELNSERVVLVAPAVSQEAGGAWVAAAVAGAICGGSDPALPLGGAELQGISALEKRLDESEVDALIRGGVTPVERVGGSCWVIRGVTTRTKTGQASDQTWRDLTTILVVDDVIPGVREALRARFPRAKNTAQTRGAVQSLVVEVLERKLAAEVITGYDAVEVTALADELAARYDVVMATEIGGGVVPMDAEAREWREAVGRMNAALAAQAETVTRIFCGLPLELKR